MLASLDVEVRLVPDAERLFDDGKGPRTQKREEVIADAGRGNRAALRRENDVGDPPDVRAQELHASSPFTLQGPR
jgi:hypothetical protein